MTQRKPSLSQCILTAAALLIAAPAMADKPDWAGNGKGGKHGDRQSEQHGRDRDGDRYDDRRGDRGGISVEFRFGNDQQRIVHDYYGEQFRSGKGCPPGLAKKHNGCMPPGQAKKWQRGYALPPDLRYYDLPRDLVVRLPVPPAGHRYVRVASDILLIAIGTSMVVDAIEDIGRQ